MKHLRYCKVKSALASKTSVEQDTGKNFTRQNNIISTKDLKQIHDPRSDWNGDSRVKFGQIYPHQAQFAAEANP